MNDNNDYKGKCSYCDSENVEIVQSIVFSETCREVIKDCYNCGMSSLGYQVILPPDNLVEEENSHG